MRIERLLASGGIRYAPSGMATVAVYPHPGAACLYRVCLGPRPPRARIWAESDGWQSASPGHSDTVALVFDCVEACQPWYRALLRPAWRGLAISPPRHRPWPGPAGAYCPRAWPARARLKLASIRCRVYRTLQTGQFEHRRVSKCLRDTCPRCRHCRRAAGLGQIDRQTGACPGSSSLLCRCGGKPARRLSYSTEPCSRHFPVPEPRPLSAGLAVESADTTCSCSKPLVSGDSAGLCGSGQVQTCSSGGAIRPSLLAHRCSADRRWFLCPAAQLSGTYGTADTRGPQGTSSAAGHWPPRSADCAAPERLCASAAVSAPGSRAPALPIRCARSSRGSETLTALAGGPGVQTISAATRLGIDQASAA